MTALSFLLFSCFQAFSVVPSRPISLSRPPFITNLLRQPVSDLFQFYAAFSLPSRLISFSVTFQLPSRLISFSVTFSLPYCLIPFFAAFSPLSRLISFSVTFSLPYCLILFFAAFSPLSRFISFSVTFSLPYCLIPFLLHSRLCPALFSTSFCYFQCIYNTFSVYFPARSFCPYLLHTPRVFISSPNATLSVDSDKQKAPALR